MIFVGIPLNNLLLSQCNSFYKQSTKDKSYNNCIKLLFCLSYTLKKWH